MALTNAHQEHLQTYSDASISDCLQLVASTNIVMLHRSGMVGKIAMQNVHEIMRVFLMCASTVFINSAYVSNEQSLLLQSPSTVFLPSR